MTDTIDPAASADFVPSHTRTWPQEARDLYADYVQDHEQTVDKVAVPVLTHKSRVLIDFRRGRDFITLDDPAQSKSKKPKQFHAHKTSISISQLLNQPIGYEYEILDRDGNFRRLNDNERVVEDEGETADPSINQSDRSPSPEITQNNANLFDSNSSQSLSQQSINAMKKSNAPALIVQALIENSATFNEKTEYSQAKYIARKQKKYVTNFSTLPCIPAHSIEAIRVNDPNRVQHATFVQFSQLLAAANVRANSLTAVIDSTAGLLSACVAQRQGGMGAIFVPVFPYVTSPLALTQVSGKDPQSINQANISLTDAEQDSIIHFPYQLCDHWLNPPAEDNEDKRVNDSMTPHYLDVHTALSSGLDSFVFLSRYDPNSMVRAMWPFLRSGASFAIHCSSPAPLLALMTWLKIGGKAAKLELNSTWHREYQVLENRTHPFVNMSQDTGCILSGIKTQPHIALKPYVATDATTATAADI